MTRRQCTYDRGLCQFVSYNSRHLVSSAQQTKTSTTVLGVEGMKDASVLYQSWGLKFVVENEEYNKSSPQACIRAVLL